MNKRNEYRLHIALYYVAYAAGAWCAMSALFIFTTVVLALVVEAPIAAAWYKFMVIGGGFAVTAVYLYFVTANYPAFIAQFKKDYL